MVEYLTPGVYVEEYGDRSKPIPGVPTSTADLHRLGAELREIVRRYHPEWTDGDPSDPGVTLVEVVAWVSDLLISRAGEIPLAGRQAAIRATAALAALASPCVPSGAPLVRPRFFAGQVLDATTLQAEQDYHRATLRRHNLALHGVGIVAGLDVEVEAGTDGSAPRVRIDPGCAIDSCGQQIDLRPGAVVPLPHSPQQLYVSLRHQDVPCAPVPTFDGGSVFSRVEEACVIALVDAVAEPALALARLSRSGGAWEVDRSFSAMRVRRN